MNDFEVLPIGTKAAIEEILRTGPKCFSETLKDSEVDAHEFLHQIINRLKQLGFTP